MRFVGVSVLAVVSAAASQSNGWDPKNKEHELALYKAVDANSPELVAKALEAGAWVDCRRGLGKQTPLMKAVLTGKEKAARELLARGASWTVPEKDGYTPPHGAGFQGRASIARLLVEHGVPIDEPHRDGFRPVQRACWGPLPRHADTVRTLLELGASLSHASECKTKNQRTIDVLQDFNIPGSHRSADTDGDDENEEDDTFPGVVGRTKGAPELTRSDRILRAKNPAAYKKYPWEPQDDIPPPRQPLPQTCGDDDYD